MGIAVEKLGVYEEMRERGAKWLRPRAVVHKFDSLRPRLVPPVPRPAIVRRGPTPAETKAFAVRDAVAVAAGLTTFDLIGPSKKRRFSAPRQLGMTIIHRLLKLSSTDAGAYFGDRDHTTVLHSVTRVTARIQRDRDFQRMYERAHGLLIARWPDFPRMKYTPLPDPIRVQDIVQIVAKKAGINPEDITRVLPTRIARRAYMVALALSYEAIQPRMSRKVIAYQFGRKLTGLFKYGAPRLYGRIAQLEGGPKLVADCREIINAAYPGTLK